MGFFNSSSKKPQAPLPNLALQLASTQDKVFKPNDTISGQVALSTPISLTPQAVEVSFWGQSDTWIRTRHSNSNSASATTHDDYRHYRDHAPLFAVTFNLFPKPHPLLPGQTYNFPFNFRVPEGTGFNRSDCYENATDERWTVLPHNLPPTFFFGTSPDTPDNCSITYGVTARLVCPGVGVDVDGDMEPVSSTAPILFQPLNTYALIQDSISVVRYPKTFTLSSSALTGLDPSSIGFRQRMHDRLSSGTPKLDFELGIEIPDLLTPGSEFRFRTTFDVIDRSNKVTHIPPIQFRVAKLELLDFTFFRAPRDWDAMNNMSGNPWKKKHYVPKPTSGFAGQEDTVYQEKKTLLNSIPDNQTVELPEVQAAGEKKQMEQANHCEIWFTGRVPSLTPPAFKSFAISRAYRVKVKMTIEVGGKKFDYEVESHIRHLGSVPGEHGV